MRGTFPAPTGRNGVGYIVFQTLVHLKPRKNKKGRTSPQGKSGLCFQFSAEKSAILPASPIGKTEFIYIIT
jgi:hypothetical protein